MQHSRKGWRIVIAGTGGQGVVTVSRALGDVFVKLGHQVVASQLHGMAQRSGSVQSSVMIDCGISPVIGKGRADIVLGLEPVETVRALPLMSSDTTVYMDQTPIVPYILGQGYVLEKGPSKYPDLDDLLKAIRTVTPKLFSFDATLMAKESGSIKSLNMVLLGCLAGSGLLPYGTDELWKVIEQGIPSKFAEPNRKSFLSGVECSRAFEKKGSTT